MGFADFFNKALRGVNMVFGDGISRQIQHDYRMMEMAQENEYRSGQIGQQHYNRLREMAQENEYQIAMQELRHNQNRELQVIMHQLRIDFDRVKRRMENSPFFHDDLDTAAMLWEEFKAEGKPLFLISPFWDETKPNTAADAGGGDTHFRTAVSSVWRESQFGSFGSCIDGVFKRPLRQTDMDLRWIRDVLKDLPVILAYGYTDGKSVHPMVATWNILPNSKLNQIVPFHGKALLPKDYIGDEGFRQHIGEAVIGISGVAMGITEDGKCLFLEQRKRLTDGTGKQSAASAETVNGVELEMIFVQGGSFMMGSNDYDDEKPVHQVTLSDFHIGKYPVTQAQWKAVMGNNPSYFKGDNLPVENVSWNDCQEFIRELNRKTGKQYRLPTEAEWEYAARGGTKSEGYTYSGSNNVDWVAEYEGNNNKTTKPVGGKKPNELGIYDMSGNVWEWCSDWYGSDYYKSSSSNNPQGPSSGSYRVSRGGSWLSYASHCRVAYRYSSSPDYGDSDLGFRLVAPR
jgi:formylglycine-generating enzyme required for sulfatase activity